jgi:hypothetical protein
MFYLFSIDPSYKAFVIIATLCILNGAIDIYRKRKASLIQKTRKR